ncbi:uncharacterized protein LOC125369967 [Ricinus communis]|uniref:uncharacterized protein LOC125369967 n=1 Tax=Ricinus communis TaxID=3988 RepID=UPI00201AC691|nr:uncharacterized protein LOC125369967 [Ricinus communis]
MVETQTGRKIKRLRTDNGGEYTSDPFMKVCQDEGRRQDTNGASQQVEHSLKQMQFDSSRCTEPTVDQYDKSTPIEEEELEDESGDEVEVPAQEPPWQHESIALSKPKRNTRKPAHFEDFVTFVSSNVDVSTTYIEAIQSSEADKWNMAMEEEMQSLEKNQTWKLASLSKKIKDEKFDMNVVGYCDSDYAGDMDKRRSTTGFVFTLAKAPVSWKSTLQSMVALQQRQSI